MDPNLEEIDTSLNFSQDNANNGAESSVLLSRELMLSRYASYNAVLEHCQKISAQLEAASISGTIGNVHYFDNPDPGPPLNQSLRNVTDTIDFCIVLEIHNAGQPSGPIFVHVLQAFLNEINKNWDQLEIIPGSPKLVELDNSIIFKLRNEVTVSLRIVEGKCSHIDAKQNK